MIDPGRLDRRITLEVPSYTTSATNEKVLGWADAPDPAEVWSMVSTTRGSEQFLAEKKTATRHRDFLIRYRSDIDETWSVVYMGLRYDIRSIEEVGRREGLVIKGEWTQGKYDS